MRASAATFALFAVSGCVAPHEHGSANDDGGGPGSATEQAGAGTEAGLGAIGFYQRWLGPQWGWHCPFEPSCSSYGAEAIREYGLLPGVLMTTDRLQRDHPYAHHQYERALDGHPIDPVASNARFVSRRGAGDGSLGFSEHGNGLGRAAAALDGDDDLGPRPGTADELLAFAEQLLEAGEFERAGVEFRRYLALYPEGEQRTRARELLAWSEVRRGRGELAFEALRPLPSPRRESFQALVLYESGRADAARRLAPDHDSSGRILRGMYALESGEWEDARTSFAALEDAAVRSLGLGGVDDAESAPRRSPTVSGTLSAVLPGSGQWYSGRKADGLMAFFLNGLLIGGTVAAAHNEEEVSAVAIGVVALGFYAGNVYGAVNAAHHFNEGQQADVLRELRGQMREHLLERGEPGRTEQGLLGFYFRF